VPPEVEWLANISNLHSRRAYEHAVKDFMRFTGIVQPVKDGDAERSFFSV
jgi:hypothetical protein